MVKVATNETNPHGGGLELGNYHFICDTVEVVTSGDSPQLLLSSTALEGPAGQRNKPFKEYFSLAGKAAGRLLKLLVAMGLMTNEEWEHSIETGELDFDEQDMVGQQYCATVFLGEPKTKGKNKDKRFPETGFTFISVAEGKEQGFPLDATSAALVLGDETAPPGNGAGGGDDDWGALV